MERPLDIRRMAVARDFCHRHWPALAISALLISGSVVSAVLMAEETPGQFLYASDDFYINFGEARRLVDGTTYGEFPSTSSCAGWVLAMAGLIKLVGADVALFLVGAINVGAGVVATWTLYRIVRESLPRVLAFCVLLLFVWAAGLVPMALIGMEHALHICFMVLFAAGLLRALDGKGGASLPIWILAGALCRMETCFAAAAGAVVLVACRRYRLAALVLGASALPVVAQGLWQLRQGHSFFSNPILIKTALNPVGNPLAAGTWMPTDTLTLLVADGLLALFIGSRCLVRREVGDRRTPLLFIAFFGMCVIAHQLLARNHWLGRYQAYLIGLGVVCLGAELVALCREVPERFLRSRVALPFGLAGLAVLMWGTAERAEVWLNLPLVSREIQTQMFQTARLAGSADAGEPVILNDVGCTLFYTDLPVIDLMGLTCWDLAKVGTAWNLEPDQLDSIAKEKGAKMAVIYPAWFQRQIPDSWVLVGGWSTPHNFYAASPVIHIYATEPRWKHTVEARWKQFMSTLSGNARARSFHLAT
jgi:hypothetical protein